MAAIIWTGKALKGLFRLLPDIEVNGKQVGVYTRRSHIKPIHFTKEEWEEVFVVLYNKMQKLKLFGTNPAKSAKALHVIVEHCCKLAKTERTNMVFRKLRHKVRMAAYYEGWITMTDIVWIEAGGDE